MTMRALGLGVVALAAGMPWALALTDTTPKKGLDKTKSAPKKNLGPDLFMAIDHRDLKGVKSLLQQGADPNYRNFLQLAPLYIAAASWQPDVMKALLDAGADPKADSILGTPLTFASATGHAMGAKMLIEKGAEVNTARLDGISPLMMAANAGNPVLVSELIKNKAKVNHTDVADSSALSFAARGGHTEVARILAEAGANLENKDELGQTPLMIAAKNGKTDVVKLLVEKGAKLDVRDATGRTPLMLAVTYADNGEIVKTLKAAGADVSLKDKRGRTAGDLASAKGFAESAKALDKEVAVKHLNTQQALTASIKALQTSMKDFAAKSNCISCHQEGLGRMMTASAQSRGFAIDEKLDKEQVGRIRGQLGELKPLHDQALVSAEAMKQVPLIEMNEVSPGYSWLFAGMVAHGDTATQATAAAAMVLARQQHDNGSWTFSLPRIPMQSSNFTMTALAVRALQSYGPRAQSTEIDERIGKAKAWLLTAPKKSSDDWSMGLLGQKWSGATLEERRATIEAILKAQNEDGGWSPVPGAPSDAYATGQMLYALAIAGEVGKDDPAFAKGTEYLLRTQDDDGTWFTAKRAIPANNYFNASFPHGESQYASFNATCWATMALLETLPRK